MNEASAGAKWKEGERVAALRSYGVPDGWSSGSCPSTDAARIVSTVSGMMVPSWLRGPRGAPAWMPTHSAE